MNKLQIFSYEENEVRTVLKDGEPWFVARDICDILGVSNPSETLKRLDEDELSSIEVTDSLGRLQKTNIVNEPGLYSLVLGSRKPVAKEFKRWLTHEVIPQIRKTGSYSIQNLSPAELLHQATGQLVEHEKKLAELEKKTALQESRLEQIENKIEKKMNSDFEKQLVTPTQIGKMFEPSKSGKAVNKMLRAAGLQFKVGGEWVATVQGTKYSSSEPVQLNNGKVIQQLKWQRQVKDLLIVD